MKKFATLALLLSLGLFAAACDKKAEKKDAPIKMDGAAAPADAAAPAEGAPAEAAPADAAK
jgi:hypothetical protein